VDAALTAAAPGGGGIEVAASASVPVLGTSADAAAGVDPAGDGATLSVGAQTPVGPVSTGAEVGIDPPVSLPDVGIEPPALPPGAGIELPPIAPRVPAASPPRRPAAPSPGEPGSGPPPTPGDRLAPAPLPSSGSAPGVGLRSQADRRKRTLPGPPARPAGRASTAVASSGPGAPPASSVPAASVQNRPSVGERVLRAVATAQPALAAIVGLLVAFGVYLGVQRRLDEGPELAWAGDRHPPDDEEIIF